MNLTREITGLRLAAVTDTPSFPKGRNGCLPVTLARRIAPGELTSRICAG